jgi:hypothetical protein
MSFDPWNFLLKIEESIRTLALKVGAHLGWGGSFLHIFLHAWEHEMWLSGFTFSPHFYKPSHGQTRSHKTHHSLDLGEATTFPLIVFPTSLHGGHIEMAFCLRLPSGSLKIPTTGTPTPLGTHNFTCRLLIVMRSKAKF